MGSFWSSGNSEEHKKEETNDESSNPSEFSENTTSIIVPSAQEIRNWKKTIRKLISEIEKETLSKNFFISFQILIFGEIFRFGTSNK